MLLWLLIGVAGGILVVHTAKSRFRHRKVSAAQFFKTLPPPRKSSPRLSLSNPFKIPALYLRLLWGLLLIGAIWMANRTWHSGGKGPLGVWFLLDASSSMTTRQSDGTCWEAAIRVLDEVAGGIAAQPEGRSANYRISLFDQALRDLGEGRIGENPGGRLIGIAPRELGTDLGLVRRALQRHEGDSGNFNCAVVISDRPAPAWLAQIENLQVVWRDVSEPVVNIGIDSIEAQRNPLNGSVAAVNVGVAVYGAEAPEVTLSVASPGDTARKSILVQWHKEGFGTVRVETAEPGMYVVRLSAGGAYSGDDEAAFRVPRPEGIRVDWRIADRTIPQSLGWTMTVQAPRFQVIPDIDQAKEDLPFLWVGSGVRQQSSEVRDFVEASPLLTDLNFDVVEQYQPQDGAPPPPFRSHLRDTDQRVWAALAVESGAAYVAGLPKGGDTPEDRLLTTLFFNAVRWLLQSSVPDPIYTLTSPIQPTPGDTRLNLHPGEGESAGQPRSFGETEPLNGGAQRGQGEPVWPIWLTAAMFVLLMERMASLWGGPRWR